MKKVILTLVFAFGLILNSYADAPNKLGEFKLDTTTVEQFLQISKQTPKQVSTFKAMRDNDFSEIIIDEKQSVSSQCVYASFIKTVRIFTLKSYVIGKISLKNLDMLFL